MKNVSNIRVIGIEIVYENEFLGVIIDDKLSWKSHINHLKTKISKTISIFYKAYPEKKSLWTLYYSLFLPYMTYCLEIWGYAYKTNTLYDLVEYKMAQIIYKVQNKLLCCWIQKLFEVNMTSGEQIKTKIKTNIKQRCVSVRGINLWNSYDSNLKRCSSFSFFKTCLKLEKYINQE